MKTLRSWWPAVVTVAAMFLLQAVLAERLPDPLPSHWNAAGAIDGTLPKRVGLWLLPGLWALLVAGSALLPRLSPDGFSIAPFAAVFRRFVLAFALFGLWLTAAIDAVCLGYPVSVPRHAVAATGMLFLVFGHGMGALTPNFYVGIRTPWTLADAGVWARTHQLGGRLWLAAGVLMLLAAATLPLKATLAVLVGAIAVSALVPVVYSFAISPRPRP